MNKLIIPAVIVAIAAASPGAWSQAPGPNPDAKTYYTTPLENDASRVVRLRAVTFAARADSGFHRHNGDQWNTVQEGEVTLTIKGQQPRTLKVGDYAYLPRGTVPARVRSGSAEHVGGGVGARPVYPRNRTRRAAGRISYGPKHEIAAR
jgi:quercetin dioxygenase-like cupin family protein